MFPYDGDQLTPEERKAEIEWIKEQIEEAKANAHKPIEDYSQATMFELEVRYDDPEARAEQIYRRGFAKMR